MTFDPIGFHKSILPGQNNCFNQYIIQSSLPVRIFLINLSGSTGMILLKMSG